MSHPDSRSDPNGGSQPSSRREAIYWDSLPIFFLIAELVPVGIQTISVITKIIYIYKTVLLHLQIRARNLHVVTPTSVLAQLYAEDCRCPPLYLHGLKTRAKIYA